MVISPYTNKIPNRNNLYKNNTKNMNKNNTRNMNKNNTRNMNKNNTRNMNKNNTRNMNKNSTRSNLLVTPKKVFYQKLVKVLLIDYFHIQ